MTKGKMQMDWFKRKAAFAKDYCEKVIVKVISISGLLYFLLISVSPKIHDMMI